MKYQLERTCRDCRHVDSFPVTKVQAAFELYDSKLIWHTPCSQCSSKNCYSLSSNRPKVDQELLHIWGNDPALYFMSQDQEIIIAEYDYFPMFLQAIDEAKYPKAKIDMLIESICILLYNNTAAPEEYTDLENSERDELAKLIRPELIKRSKRIMEADYRIMDYIKEVVYPQIGLK